MKSPIMLSFLLFFTPFFLHAQTINGIIKDATNKEVLGYVHIGVLGKNLGTISNEKGQFKMDLSYANPNDSLYFSMLGYEAKGFRIGEVKDLETWTVELSPSSFELKEIVVGQERPLITFGSTKASKTTTGWSNNEKTGAEVGTNIKVEKGLYKMKDLNFHLRFNTADSLLFRLNIYTLKNGLPHTSILQENIFLTAYKKQKWISHDLSTYNLLLDEEVIVTLELVEAYFKENYHLFFTYAKSTTSGATYIRKSSQAKWEKIPNAGLAFYLNVQEL
ncbi:MAG: carboxypeptidase-like regulatory domain-containing protein [Bacteroidota bacterium]